tara:strand:- start:502 stop:747 length:246 start_codon:yes stop_codon:yes gene_type:complete
VKIRKLLKIQEVIDGIEIPNEIKSLEPYYSQSLGDIVDVLDMDLNNLIRAFIHIETRHKKLDSLSGEFINTFKNYMKTLKK